MPDGIPCSTEFRRSTWTVRGLGQFDPASSPMREEECPVTLLRYAVVGRVHSQDLQIVIRPTPAVYLAELLADEG